ncbi:hypothetical protein BDZ89DRAFT_1138137 [Hymenopellis radicata]|nr:hypothetical protein BDZ89DRAFT_1138137 [Hymenopellis radicata]
MSCTSYSTSSASDLAISVIDINSPMRAAGRRRILNDTGFTNVNAQCSHRTDVVFHKAELDLEVVDMAVVVVMGVGERLGSVVRKKHSESPSSRPLFGLVHPLLVEMESRQVCSYFPLAVNSYSGIDLLTVLEPRCT